MTGLPEQGSLVRLKLRTWAGEIEEQGILLPPAAPGHLTMKLVNGYNISHPESSLISFELISESTPPDSEDEATDSDSQDSNLPLVRILHTGGTIASKVDYATGAVVARFEPEELLAAIPELAAVARIEAVKLGNMWSDDIRPQHWNAMLAASAEAFADGAAGVVVTHGTDTLAVSATALAFGWAGEGGCPPGRIVFTGSQRSSDRGSSDAGENLIAAVHWAAHGPAPNGGLGDATVVMLHAGADDGTVAVLPGCSARKLHSSRRDAFKSVNAGVLAQVQVSREGINHTLMPEYEAALKSTPQRGSSGVEPTNYDGSIRVAQLISGAHLHGDLITAVADAGYRALVIHGTGLGHLPIENANGDAPENEALEAAISAAISGGLKIVIANQCINGAVNMNVYSKGRRQQEIGLLGHGGTSTPEAVLVKTHWSLSQRRDLAADLESNLVGENPDRISS